MEENLKLENIGEAGFIKRLGELKEERFLSHRVFKRISENMHYEIFKFVSPIDLLGIRITNLGGYQLTSNPIMRSRITNYFTMLKCYELDINNIDLGLGARRIRSLFECSGRQILQFRKRELGVDGGLRMAQLFRFLPEIIGLNFGTIRSLYIYIYIW